MIQAPTKLPDTQTLMEFRKDRAAKVLANEIRNRLMSSLSAMPLESVLAIAIELDGEPKPIKTSLEALKKVVLAETAAAADFGALIREVADSEQTTRLNERVTPALDRLDRTRQILQAHMGELEGAEKRIEERRAMLRKSGVPELVVTQIVPDFDEKAHQAHADEAQTLREEIAALEKFIETGDEIDLNGIVLGEVLRVEPVIPAFVKPTL